ncbi:DEAD/DEAH box helicase [Candidatus Gracilibacteria bacterium]|nr:DEAD/DEAH box helicase [Candidatus Gracilibacteria bacterium]
MFIVLDLETTGLLAKEDEIIEIACVKIDRKTFLEVDRFSSFVKSKKEIPEFISQITNIFSEDISNAPEFKDIIDDVQNFIEGYPIIGHNIQFDIGFLESHGVNVSKNPSIDTFFLANFLCSDEKSLNLGYLCEVLGIELQNAHRALDDTLATAELFRKLIAKLQSSSYEYGEYLYYFLDQCGESGIKILKDLYLQKPEFVLSSEEFVEKYIKDLSNNIHDIQDISMSKVNENLSDFLEKIPNFELRDSQKSMLDTVDKTLSNGKKSLIEAPTGIGKTFAYLLPALQYSLNFGEQVHVSTSTKALQDQIFYKDLAFLKTHFPHEFSYTKLKGKRNYLGVSSLLEFIDQQGILSSSHCSFLLKIVLWSIKSEFGELDELDFYGEEFSHISEIHAGNGFILSDSNPFKLQEFAHRARLRAKSANIIITNNHILFQDIASEGSLLGGVQNLIIDEAHVLEDVVTSSLKKTVNFQLIQKSFQKIEKKIQKYKISDLEIDEVKQKILYESAELFSFFEGEIFSKFSSGAQYKMLLLKQDFFDAHKDLSELAKKIIYSIQGLIKEIKSLDESISQKLSQEMQELLNIKDIFQTFFENRDMSEFIYYMSYDDTRGLQLHTTVLKPGNFLEEKLWSSLKSVILTSATLQLSEDFSYIQGVLSLDDFDTFVLPSDFDYHKQALVYIPQDLGSIKNNLPEIIDFLADFFRVVKGRTLMLCTAFFVIREIYTKYKIILERENINLLAQSISGSKYKQIDFFKKNPENSILLGTDTFWEGIDIPGDDLKYLLIHKIPFSVPSDPIFQARSQLYKDSFSEYAIPKSILKLKQGFGRLIRTKSDTGIIVFLDDRIYSTKWGEKYYQAFPKDIKIRYGSSQKLIDLLDKSK